MRLRSELYKMSFYRQCSYRPMSASVCYTYTFLNNLCSYYSFQVICKLKESYFLVYTLKQIIYMQLKSDSV